MVKQQVSKVDGEVGVNCENQAQPLCSEHCPFTVWQAKSSPPSLSAWKISSSLFSDGLVQFVVYKYKKNTALVNLLLECEAIRPAACPWNQNHSGSWLKPQQHYPQIQTCTGQSAKEGQPFSWIIRVILKKILSVLSPAAPAILAHWLWISCCYSLIQRSSQAICINRINRNVSKLHSSTNQKS